MLNAWLTHCEECANYGTYVDSPLVYMHLCRWSAMSTRVKKQSLFSYYVPLLLPGPLLDPWNWFGYRHTMRFLCWLGWLVGSWYISDSLLWSRVSEYKWIPFECSTPLPCLFHECSSDISRVVLIEPKWHKKKHGWSENWGL